MKFLQSLEWMFRHFVVYPFFRVLFRNPPHEGKIDIRCVKKVLILRYDRIGDMIVTTPILRKLKASNPHLEIGLFTSPLNAEIIRFHPAVDRIFVLEKNWLKLIGEVLRARREQYDVVLNLIFNRTTSGALLANVIAPRGIKIGQGDDKYRFYFNKLLKLERMSAHMVETLAFIVKEVFGIELTGEELNFEIVIDDQSRRDVDAYLRHHGLRRRKEPERRRTPFIVFNISATDWARRISVGQAKELVEFFARRNDVRTVIIYAPNDTEMETAARHAAQSASCLVFPENGTATLREITSLIEGALCVVTPDTSIVHFASATQTPVIGFFTPLQDVHEWLPWGVKHAIVSAPAGKSVAAISADEMKREVDRFLHSVRDDHTEMSAANS